MDSLKGSFVLPQGFKAGSAAVGIKPGSGKKDVAVIHSDRPASAAALYTTNQVKAAPLLVSGAHLKNGVAQAIVANSGNANACTGQQGVQNAKQMCCIAGNQLGLSAEDVLAASTGVIGRQLPMDRVEQGIKEACDGLSPEGGLDAAQAIMTTDTIPKTVCRDLGLPGKKGRLSGMCKGSGMIAPNLATLLVFLMTDVTVSSASLQGLLRKAVQGSFNWVTVDGDMSTNDFLAVLANGASGSPELVEGTDEYALFAEAVDTACLDLARQIAGDGEGATKLVRVNVSGARDRNEARRVGMSVANSALVKTALFGNDPNWGRILAAVGCSGVDAREELIKLAIGNLRVYERGKAVDFDEGKARDVLSQAEVDIDIDLGQGSGSGTVYTCDLSYDYVRINAEYTT